MQNKANFKIGKMNTTSATTVNYINELRTTNYELIMKTKPNKAIPERSPEYVEGRSRMGQFQNPTPPPKPALRKKLSKSVSSALFIAKGESARGFPNTRNWLLKSCFATNCLN